MKGEVGVVAGMGLHAGSGCAANLHDAGDGRACDLQRPGGDHQAGHCRWLAAVTIAQACRQGGRIVFLLCAATMPTRRDDRAIGSRCRVEAATGGDGRCRQRRIIALPTTRCGPCWPVEPMTTVLLSLGSNVAPEQHLAAAVAALRGHFDVRAVSPAYRTPAVGFDGPAFLNNALALESDWPLARIEQWLHALEDAHGRDRSGPKFSDRTLDVDVVFYGAAVIREAGRQRIPRPELRHAFVLQPLADIAPDFIDPVSGRSLSALWQAHPQYGQQLETVPLG